MNKKEVLKKVEDFVIHEMSKVREESHGFRHVDRVRKWALKIAKNEKDVNIFLLEVSALLHDIGKYKEKTETHYDIGERIARKFLKNLKYFSEDDIDLICLGIKYHGEGLKEKQNIFVEIIRDADILDKLGAVVVGRAFSYFYFKPHYIDKNSFVRKKWSDDTIKKNLLNQPWNQSCIDNLNFNLDTFRQLSTKTGKKLGKWKYKYLSDFIKQFKKETIDL